MPIYSAYLGPELAYLGYADELADLIGVTPREVETETTKTVQGDEGEFTIYNLLAVENGKVSLPVTCSKTCGNCALFLARATKKGNRCDGWDAWPQDGCIKPANFAPFWWPELDYPFPYTLK